MVKLLPSLKLRDVCVNMELEEDVQELKRKEKEFFFTTTGLTVPCTNYKELSQTSEGHLGRSQRSPMGVLDGRISHVYRTFWSDQWFKALSESRRWRKMSGKCQLGKGDLKVYTNPSRKSQYISQAPKLKNVRVAYATLERHLLSMRVLQQDTTVTGVAKQVTWPFPVSPSDCRCHSNFQRSERPYQRNDGENSIDDEFSRGGNTGRC
ncbi:unnamed protein product [Lepeophtheirus salmonis]|uniref:(salmon louse) hypothetical protein n=1 Tax=Lepeophtheirus salmonis TaxID=72036 RepID=A0A7R8HD39_LEPSM|nr:unnamed protein product [Lepeophtheirus salmonis]CAF3015749.1 unnamed protein product [Lepeophtheirus salmonis]